MSYQQHILELYQAGEVHRIYENVEAFNYLELKACYLQGSDEFRQTLSRVKSAYGNTLYHITMYQEDVDLFLMLSKDNHDASVFEVCAFDSLLPYATNVQAQQIYTLFEQGHFKLNSVNYAYACYNVMMNKELLEQHPVYQKIATHLLNHLDTFLIQADDFEHARFFYLLECLLEEQDLSDSIIQRIDNVYSAHQKRLFHTLFSNTMLVEQAYNLSYIKHNNPVKTSTQRIKKALLNYFDQLPTHALETEEVLACFEKRATNIIKMNEAALQESFIDNQQFIYMQDFVSRLARHLNEYGEISQRGFIKLMFNTMREELECLNYPLQTNYIQAYLDEKEFHHIYVQKKLCGNKKTAQNFIDLLEKLHPLYQQLLRQLPVFIKSNSSESVTQASLFSMDNTPLLIDVKHFSSTILTHELTHFLQLAYAQKTGQTIGEIETWQSIKSQLLNQTFPTPKEVAELLNDLMGLSGNERDQHTQLCEEHLLHLLKTCENTYETDPRVEKYREQLSSAFLHNLFVSYKVSYDKKEDFLMTLQKNMDLQIQYDYYKTDMEFHARVCEYLYSDEHVVTPLLHALTFGLGNKTELKNHLRESVQTLNNNMAYYLQEQKKVQYKR